MQTTNNSSRATFAVTPYNTDPPNSVDRNVISPEEMPVKSARIAGKNHDPVWRNPDRRNNVRFEFTTPEGGTFEVRCEDASIRSARFSLTDKQRILASHSSAKIFLSDQPMVATLRRKPIMRFSSRLEPVSQRRPTKPRWCALARSWRG